MAYYHFLCVSKMQTFVVDARNVAMTTVAMATRRLQGLVDKCFVLKSQHTPQHSCFAPPFQFWHTWHLINIMHDIRIVLFNVPPQKGSDPKWKTPFNYWYVRNNKENPIFWSNLGIGRSELSLLPIFYMLNRHQTSPCIKYCYWDGADMVLFHWFTDS